MRHVKEDLFRDEPADRLRAALAGLSHLQRALVLAALSGDDECGDEEIADRYGTSAAAVRQERILARRHLNQSLMREPEKER